MEGFTIVETVNLQSLDRAKGRKLSLALRTTRSNVKVYIWGRQIPLHRFAYYLWERCRSGSRINASGFEAFERSLKRRSLEVDHRKGPAHITERSLQLLPATINRGQR